MGIPTLSQQLFKLKIQDPVDKFENAEKSVRELVTSDQFASISVLEQDITRQHKELKSLFNKASDENKAANERLTRLLKLANDIATTVQTFTGEPIQNSKERAIQKTSTLDGWMKNMKEARDQISLFHSHLITPVDISNEIKNSIIKELQEASEGDEPQKPTAKAFKTQVAQKLEKLTTNAFVFAASHEPMRFRNEIDEVLTEINNLNKNAKEEEKSILTALTAIVTPRLERLKAISVRQNQAATPTENNGSQTITLIDQANALQDKIDTLNKFLSISLEALRKQGFAVDSTSKDQENAILLPEWINPTDEQKHISNAGLSLKIEGSLNHLTNTINGRSGDQSSFKSILDQTKQSAEQIRLAADLAKNAATAIETTAYHGAGPAIMLLLAIGGMFITFSATSLLAWVRGEERQRDAAEWDRKTERFIGVGLSLLAKGVDPVRVLSVTDQISLKHEGDRSHTTPSPLSQTLAELVSAIKGKG